MGFPALATEDGQYLVSLLGEPLIKGLSEVATMRPKDPITYLANYLIAFSNETKLPAEAEKPKILKAEQKDNLEEAEGQKETTTEPSKTDSDLDKYCMGEDEESPPQKMVSSFKPVNRDEHGQSTLHFAAARTHGRNAFLQLLQETDANIGLRDELYRTARDIAEQVNIPDNVQNIDKYIVSLAAKGTEKGPTQDDQKELECKKSIEQHFPQFHHLCDRVKRVRQSSDTLKLFLNNERKLIHSLTSRLRTEKERFQCETEKLNELMLEGYDHILDAEDDRNIIDTARVRGHDSTVSLLNIVITFEERRDKLHRAIRFGSLAQVIEAFEGGNGRMLATAKNQQGRCSLHIAVLCQQEKIVEHIAKKYRDTLCIGDNLMRTPLHYAMGVEEVETLSKILIDYGAERVSKDLKGRQPSYYYMNKSDILTLQDEEEAQRV